MDENRICAVIVLPTQAWHKLCAMSETPSKVRFVNAISGSLSQCCDDFSDERLEVGVHAILNELLMRA